MVGSEFRYGRTPQLAEVLARMVESALAWEKEHGIPGDNGLTGIHQRIHCSPPKNPSEGDEYDDPLNSDEPI